MKLTGQAREDFEKWYYTQHTQPYKTEKYSGEGLGFLDLAPSMQYGVYVDWFDSVGIDISVCEHTKGKYIWCTEEMNKANLWERGATTRNEARTKAIEKATEIYNEKHETN